MHPTLAPTHAKPAQLLIACLCAQWCNTCGSYRSVFDQLQAEFPSARFVWIDIEDEADLIDPIEVENFPTVLIAVDKVAQFFGTITPQEQTLRRLIQAQQSHAENRAVDSPTASDTSPLPAQVQALVMRL